MVKVIDRYILSKRTCVMGFCVNGLKLKAEVMVFIAIKDFDYRARVDGQRLEGHVTIACRI